MKILLFYSRDDVIGTTEFTIADLLDDGINGEYEMADADGNSVGNINVNINFEAGDGKYFNIFWFHIDTYHEITNY